MPTPKGVSMEMQMDAIHQACPWGVFLICTSWVPFVVPFGILNLSNDTCEMNLTLWMQLEICVLFALPALIFFRSGVHCLFQVPLSVRVYSWQRGTDSYSCSYTPARLSHLGLGHLILIEDLKGCLCNAPRG